MNPFALIGDSPAGLTIQLAGHTIPLKPGLAERTILNVLLALRGGATESALIPHVRDHQLDMNASCHFCKLEGRVLAAMGRSRDIPQTRTRSTEKTIVRRIPAGISGAQLAAMSARGATPSEYRKAAKANERYSPPETVARLEDLL